MILLSSEPHDVDSLAKIFGTSDKTIRRDIRLLIDSGIKVSEQSGRNNLKTYWIDRRELPPVKWNYEEALALFLGQSAFRSFSGSNVDESSKKALHKLKQYLGEAETKFVETLVPRIGFAGQIVSTNDCGFILDELLVAIEDNRVTCINHDSLQNADNVYDIHPYGLVDYRGSVYVIGHSCQHNEIRTWKVDRIRTAELSDRKFDRPEDFDIGKFFHGAFAIWTGDHEHIIRIRFLDSAAIQYVKEREFHPTQKHQAQADGTLLVELRLQSLVEVKAWILSFGPKAEVLTPPELRQSILEDVAKLSLLYRNDSM